MNNLVKFNNHNIELISYNGRDYMALSQIVIALETTAHHISQQYNRHKSEFDEEMSCLIRKGNTRVRIFNREGAWLLGMLVRTNKAAEFRKWVLKTLRIVVDNVYPCGEVAVKEHTRSLPVCRKKEIVLSEKAKTEIGGIVKACVSAEFGRLVNAGDTKTESWEVSDADLLRYLHNWYATKHRQTTLDTQRIVSENSRLSEENREMLRRINLISQVLG